MLIHCFSNLWISYPHFLWITICFQKLYGKHQKTDPLANGWTAIRDLKNCWSANTFAHNNKVFHINCHFIHFICFIRMSCNVLIVMPYFRDNKSNIDSVENLSPLFVENSSKFRTMWNMWKTYPQRLWKSPWAMKLATWKRVIHNLCG